jgi:hypothetical protein
MHELRNTRSIMLVAAAIAVLSVSAFLLIRYLSNDGSASVAEMLDDAKESVCDVSCQLYRRIR